MSAPPEPVGKFDRESGLWLLTEPWRCPLGDGRTLCIAPGFESDGASIPRILWRVAGPRYNPSTGLAPALAHDAMYAAELTTRRDADDALYRLLRACGVCVVQAWSYWSAVRVAGWAVWARHTVESVEDARRYCALFEGYRL